MEVLVTPLELTEEAYGRFLKGDIPGLVDLYADNATFTPAMGLQGKISLLTPQGRFPKAQMVAYFTRLTEEVEITKWENREFVACGNTVVVLGEYAGKIKRTGKPFACEFAQVNVVAEGKFVSFKEFTDTAMILEAFS
jgi:uncharacterized protein